VVGLSKREKEKKTDRPMDFNAFYITRDAEEVVERFKRDGRAHRI
jgi:hypothetical protein